MCPTADSLTLAAGYKVPAMTRRPGWTPGALRLANLRAHPDRLKVENAAGSDDDTATMYVYDEISWCGVTAEAFAKELDSITASTITLRLNSPGGDLFDGIAIYNSLVSHPATVNVQVDGLAASAASVIAMAGDTIKMMRGTQLMVHDGLGMCIGNAGEMLKTAELLDQGSNEIAGLYAHRAGGDRSAWRDIMRAETWYTGPEAVTAGLANEAVPDDDETESATKDGPKARFDLSVFAYAGREHAPPPKPVTAGPPAIVPALFDPGAYRANMHANRTTQAVANYGDLLRTALGRHDV